MMRRGLACEGNCSGGAHQCARFDLLRRMSRLTGVGRGTALQPIPSAPGSETPILHFGVPTAS